mmetsp:Transcript_102738/g.165515  ORF Transcript_102738/g.165515 Transcript_102738/m.165515 type:complete len:272 (+) Transcript_102738:275-1090(+)
MSSRRASCARWSPLSRVWRSSRSSVSLSPPPQLRASSSKQRHSKKAARQSRVLHRSSKSLSAACWLCNASATVSHASTTLCFCFHIQMADASSSFGWCLSFMALSSIAGKPVSPSADMGEAGIAPSPPPPCQQRACAPTPAASDVGKESIESRSVCMTIRLSRLEGALPVEPPDARLCGLLQQASPAMLSASRSCKLWLLVCEPRLERFQPSTSICVEEAIPPLCAAVSTDGFLLDLLARLLLTLLLTLPNSGGSTSSSSSEALASLKSEA